MAELSELGRKSLLQINTLLQTVLAELDVPPAQGADGTVAAPQAEPLPLAPADAPPAAPIPPAPPEPATSVLLAAGAEDPNVVSRPVAWGARVSKAFVARAWWTAATLRFDPDWLMSYIAWESGRTFKPDVKNMAGSGATGLIQFMPKVALSLGTSVEALARMSAEDQILYVYRYFRPFAGKIHTFADGYMAILWPAAVGRPDDDKLFTGGTAYRQNSGLDADKDGVVTKLEAAARPLALLATGRKPENLGMGV